MNKNMQKPYPGYSRKKDDGKGRGLKDGTGINRMGFTLIEMLVVIAIIALLASLVAGGVSRSMERARRVACANNLRQISTAYYNLLINDQQYFHKIERNHAHHITSNRSEIELRTDEFHEMGVTEELWFCPSNQGWRGSRNRGFLNGLINRSSSVIGYAFMPGFRNFDWQESELLGFCLSRRFAANEFYAHDGEGANHANKDGSVRFVPKEHFNTKLSADANTTLFFRDDRKN